MRKILFKCLAMCLICFISCPPLFCHEFFEKDDSYSQGMNDLSYLSTSPHVFNLLAQTHLREFMPMITANKNGSKTTAKLDIHENISTFFERIHTLIKSNTINSTLLRVTKTIPLDTLYVSSTFNPILGHPLLKNEMFDNMFLFMRNCPLKTLRILNASFTPSFVQFLGITLAAAPKDLTVELTFPDMASLNVEQAACFEFMWRKIEYHHVQLRSLIVRCENCSQESASALISILSTKQKTIPNLLLSLRSKHLQALPLQKSVISKNHPGFTFYIYNEYDQLLLSVLPKPSHA